MMSEQTSFMEGLAAKEIAQSAHEVTYKDWLREARRAAYAHARANGKVTSDDVHRLTPLPAWIHHNVMGSVFKSQHFVMLGFVQSARKSAHARWIREYAIAPRHGNGG
jgi:hypothetical protein